MSDLIDDSVTTKSEEPTMPKPGRPSAADIAKNAVDTAAKALEGADAARAAADKAAAGTDALLAKLAQMEALLAKVASGESAPKQPSQMGGGRQRSDDEIMATIEGMSQDDVHRFHELVAARAEAEAWADRGISPATHLVAKEPMQIMYEGKVVRTKVGQAYERAKMDPKDIARRGDTHFIVPKLAPTK